MLHKGFVTMCVDPFTYIISAVSLCYTSSIDGFTIAYWPDYQPWNFLGHCDPITKSESSNWSKIHSLFNSPDQWAQLLAEDRRIRSIILSSLKKNWSLHGYEQSKNIFRSWNFKGFSLRDNIDQDWEYDSFQLRWLLSATLFINYLRFKNQSVSHHSIN